jgi:hypothetical protein
MVLVEVRFALRRSRLADQPAIRTAVRAIERKAAREAQLTVCSRTLAVMA